MPQLMPGNSLGFLLVDIARLFRQEFDRAVHDAGIGLTPGEVRALAYVARYTGSRQATLAERMGVEPMTLSAYLDRLENRGLVVRRVNPSDRRAKVVEPTKEAEAVFEQARPLANQTYERIVGGFNEEERKLAETLLRRMRLNMTTDPAVIGEDTAAIGEDGAASGGTSAAGMRGVA